MNTLIEQVFLVSDKNKNILRIYGSTRGTFFGISSVPLLFHDNGHTPLSIVMIVMEVGINFLGSTVERLI